MSRKFSLAYLTIPGTAPVDQIRIAKEAGYDFVSLRTIPMHLPGEPEFLLHKDAKLFEETRQALKEYDMPVMDIELARVRPDLDINEYDPAFEKAAELGATDVLGSIWTRDKAYYIDQVAKIAECNVVMNASGIGMGSTIGQTPMPVEHIQPGQFYFDACYNPDKTQFLLNAEEKGCQVLNGLGMSLYQGAAQIELWTGEKAPVEAMRKELMDILAESK